MTKLDPYFARGLIELYRGDCHETLARLPAGFAHACVTSPPYYGLKDYGVDGQIGLESTVDQYLDRLVAAFRTVRRALRADATLWLNLGDTHRNKQQLGIPWRVAFALQDDGWVLRQENVWHKPSINPAGVRDRPYPAHEQVFLFSPGPRYYYDQFAVREATADGVATRNLRSVWTIQPRPFKGAHFATFPPELAGVCVRAGTSDVGACGACGAPRVRQLRRPTPPRRGAVEANKRDGGRTAADGMERTGLSHYKYNQWLRQNPPTTAGWRPGCRCQDIETVPCVVLDPFCGVASAAIAARDLGRRFVGVELNVAYLDLAAARLVSGSDKDRLRRD